jgi:drug/metabolite transporter (DMT)-like permease
MVLLVVTVIWGGTFLTTQTAMGDSGPFGLLATRFAVGSLALLVVYRRRMSRLGRDEVRAGVIIGVVTFASYAFQTTGLQLIASSKSAFITAMYVPVVPLLQVVLIGVAPRVSAWIGIGVSFTGLIFLSSGEGIAGGGFGAGEWLTLGGALTAALQIVLISRWAPLADPMRLACLQLAIVAVLSLAAIALTNEALPSPTPTFLTASLGLGILGTAFALGAMNWAQQTISATRATIIYAMEPVWGGLFGAIAGEPMTAAIVTGSSLIVLGVLVSELRWGLWPFRRAETEHFDR